MTIAGKQPGAATGGGLAGTEIGHGDEQVCECRGVENPGQRGRAGWDRLFWRRAPVSGRPRRCPLRFLPIVDDLGTNSLLAALPQGVRRPR
jgi:hypothetical protein